MANLTVPITGPITGAQITGSTSFYDPFYDPLGHAYPRFDNRGPEIPRGGSSIEQVLKYLHYMAQTRGGIDERTQLCICEALMVIVKTQNDKIEELEGMLFDHIEDGSDLDGE
jgi:hypothetical protein